MGGGGGADPSAHAHRFLVNACMRQPSIDKGLTSCCLYLCSVPPQYLALLLAAPDPEVVLAALQALAAFYRKSSSPSVRRVSLLPLLLLTDAAFSADESIPVDCFEPDGSLPAACSCLLPGCRWEANDALNHRLASLAGGWGGADDAPDLLACARAVQPGGQALKVRCVGLCVPPALLGFPLCAPPPLVHPLGPLPAASPHISSLLSLLQVPSSLHYQFYLTSTQARRPGRPGGGPASGAASAAAEDAGVGAAAAGGASGLRVIDVPGLGSDGESGVCCMHPAVVQHGLVCMMCSWTWGCGWVAAEG